MWHCAGHVIHVIPAVINLVIAIESFTGVALDLPTLIKEYLILPSLPCISLSPTRCSLSVPYSHTPQVDLHTAPHSLPLSLVLSTSSSPFSSLKECGKTTDRHLSYLERFWRHRHAL